MSMLATFIGHPFSMLIIILYFKLYIQITITLQLRGIVCPKFNFIVSFMKILYLIYTNFNLCQKLIITSQEKRKHTCKSLFDKKYYLHVEGYQFITETKKNG